MKHAGSKRRMGVQLDGASALAMNDVDRDPFEEGARSILDPVEKGEVGTSVRRRIVPADRAVPVTMSVAHAILDILEAEGVEYIFGVPGGPLTGLFEAMQERQTIRMVLAKHEGGAAFMAATYARVARRLAVCCGTSGPGATNALTGIASAYTESLPVLLLTGQVATSSFGKGAIQESSVHGVDVVQIFRPVTKLSTMLPHVDRSADIVRTAIRMALSGRPGPVHVNMPADMIAQPTQHLSMRPSQYRPADSTVLDRRAVRHAAEILAGARSPCILAGHGVALANAARPLLKLARAIGAPVATTPKGKGVFPENDPLSIGVVGFGGHERAEAAIESGEIDVLVVVGSSMNEFVTNAWTLEVRPRALIQIDVDPHSIGKNYPVDASIVGDAGLALTELLAELPPKAHANAVPASAARDLSSGTHRISVDSHDEDARVKPRDIIFELRHAMPEDAMLFVDTGNSILWATHYFEVRQPDTYFVDLGLGAMGSAIAGVVGGALAAPSRRAIALVGDAAFAMHGVEVHTAVEAALPIIWVVLNNGGHGMVHHGDTIMKGRDLGVALYGMSLDIATMAAGLGARSARVDTLHEFRSALAEAMDAKGPWVIDARIDAGEVPPTLERRVQSLSKALFSRRHPTSGGR
jgi:acetolactate synthase-1/2/3 large subunit